MQRKMRVLVTGGAGFIGSNVVKMLEAKGVETVILDDFSHASYKNLLKVNGEIICGDILDEGIYAKLPKIDAVIHEAAITDTTLADDTKMMMVNYQGFKNVAAFCLNKKIRLVYASSAGVYGNGTAAMKEDAEIIPHNTYGYSKYQCDCLMKKITKKSSTPIIVGLRYFNVYGPGEYHKGLSASMTYQLYLQMKEGKQPRIFKFGEQKRDFIYVKDVARITIEALNSKKSSVINLGTGTPRSFNDIVSGLNKTMGLDLKPEYLDNPYSGKYQDYTEADTALLKEVLGTQAQTTLEAGIEDYLKGHLL